MLIIQTQNIKVPALSSQALLVISEMYNGQICILTFWWWHILAFLAFYHYDLECELDTPHHTHSCLNLNGGGCQSWHQTMGTFQTIYTSQGQARELWHGEHLPSPGAHAALKRADKKLDLKKLVDKHCHIVNHLWKQVNTATYFSQNPSSDRRRRLTICWLRGADH